MKSNFLSHCKVIPFSLLIIYLYFKSNFGVHVFNDEFHVCYNELLNPVIVLTVVSTFLIYKYFGVTSR